MLTNFWLQFKFHHGRFRKWFNDRIINKNLNQKGHNMTQHVHSPAGVAGVHFGETAAEMPSSELAVAFETAQ
jgi:hypothetical protein